MTRTMANDGVLAQIMEQMEYGVYIVGSVDADGEPNGMMADWVMQIAFQPRTVAVSFENDAHTLANIRDTRYFTVNFLPQDDDGRELAARFLQPYYDAKILGRHRPSPGIHHKLDGVVYGRAAHGAPVLDGAIAWLECQVERLIPVGDHTLVTAHVVTGDLLREAQPLTSGYAGWSYAG